MKAAQPKKTPPPRPAQTSPAEVAGVCVFLILAVLVIFGQAAHFQFVNFDDEENVYLNPVVTKGLSLKAVGWAFTHAQTANWIPFTTLSHMLDCQLFGLQAGGHHVVNVLWHAANAVLLFLVLRQMTGSLWRSAVVAALFAVHPLRSESVAWVSERKDVLSGFFFLLTIGAYVRCARRPSVSRSMGMVLLFAAGLLAKTMVATLPFVLLLLDYWPLQRLRGWKELGALVREKIPLFALAAAACVAAAFVPGLIITDNHRLTFVERVANALVSCVIYIRQMIFPAGLAALYPLAPGGAPWWKAALALLLLAAITAAAVAWRKNRPWLLVGWLWYLGMLFPVSGIIQISSTAAHADRYTYLSEIGLAIAGTWAMSEWSARWRNRQVSLAGLTAVVLGALAVSAYSQTSYWRSGAALWSHTVSCTSSNSLAQVYLGAALAREGRADLAIAHYRTALAIAPDNLAALNNLATALANAGTASANEEAIACFQKALQIDPASKVAHYNLAVALSAKGATEGAIAQYREALASDPDFVDAHLSLGNALRKRGQIDEAILHFRKVLKIMPDSSAAWSGLGLAFMQQGNRKEAEDAWQQSLAIQPAQPDAQNNLAWLLATSPEAGLRNGAKAVDLAEQAGSNSGGVNLNVLRTLAAAYAEAGRFHEATAAIRRALDLGAAQKGPGLAANLQNDLKLYQANTPLRDPPK